MNVIKYFRTGCSFGVVACMLYSGAAAAQSATDQADAANAIPADIIITAQFRSQRLQDAPLAISAVNADTLEARSQTNVIDVGAQAPSVTLKNQGAAYGPSLAASIRGVGQYDFSPAFEPGVGFYVDDVYYATLTGSIVDLLDLDRVEILRGPQGTLAGKNSIGGAIKLFSKAPEGSNTGFISATYGRFNRIDLRGSADFKIANDLSMRISGVSKTSDGYVKRLDFGCANPGSGVASTLPAGSNCVLGRMGEVNFQALRGVLRYTGVPDLDVKLSVDYTSEKRSGSPTALTYIDPSRSYGNVSTLPSGFNFQQFVIPAGAYYTYANFTQPTQIFNSPFGPIPVSALSLPDEMRYHGGGVSLNLAYKLGNGYSINSISAYRAYKTSFNSDTDGSPLGEGVNGTDLDYWQYSQELRLNGSIGSALDYTVGGFYLKAKTTTSGPTDTRFGIVPIIFYSDHEPVEAETKAVFAQATFHATDKLNLTGGVRYTDESKDYTFFRYNLDGSFNPFVSGTNGKVASYKGNRVDYRVAIDYRWSDQLMTYAQVSTGFKGGGVNPRPLNSAQLLPFNPETITSFEAGFKSDLLDRKVRLNAAAFFSKYKDIQVTLSSCPAAIGNPCFVPANSGNADIKGFELETTIRPVPEFTIDGSLSYTDFDYKLLSPFAVASGLTLQDKPVNTPAWKYSFGVQYEVALGGGFSITPRFDGSYQSTSFGRAQNRDRNRIPGYFLGNARITLANEKDGWDLSLEVRNVFNKYYYISNFDLGQGFVTSTPGRPREWAATIKKTF